MTGVAAFSDAAREAVLGRTFGRCAGCGRSDVTIQHRVARMMGGRHRIPGARLAHPANGLALCGHGTAGCHGWVEHHPAWGRVLGWNLPDGCDPVMVPYYTRSGVWTPWAACDPDGLTVHVYPDDALTQLRSLFGIEPVDVARAVGAFTTARRLAP